MVVLVTLPACAGNSMGTLGDILGGVLGSSAGGAQQEEVLVEVQAVDTRQQAIQVRTERGETGAILFDRNTVVVYQQQQYPVTALERGDVVVMQVQQIDGNRLYTPRIDVRQSVQERTGQAVPGVSGQRRQMSGRVGRIDHQRGFFELQTQQGTYTVVLPANPGPATTDYFRRLRAGASVTLEGTFNGTDRIDLYRFI